jgi:hypothetical protein
MGPSLGGWLGAMIGTIVAVAGYAMIIPGVERRLRARDKAGTRQEREAFEEKLSVMRRMVLGLDVVAFASLGYWFGRGVV